MSEKQTIIYTDHFRHAIDDKNRVTIPSKWRLRDGEEYFVSPNPNNGGCLSVYTQSEFQNLLAKVDAMLNVPEAQKTNFKRSLSARTLSSSCDKSGRINLSEELKKYAGIQQEAVLVGRGENFEIWEPGRFEAQIRVADDHFNELAKLAGM